MKKRLITIIMAAAVSVSMFAGCGSNKEDAKTESEPVVEAVTEVVSEVSEVEETESEADELPFKMAMKPSAYRNDTTGNWYTAAYSGSEVMSDYALEYYHQYFSSDDEIHFVWNAALKTVTRISVVAGELDVATYEYVDGEEHDAKMACTGQKYNEYYVNMETGEKEEIE